MIWYYVKPVTLRLDEVIERCIYLSLAGVDALSDTVDFLVHFRSVMVTLLTSAGNSELDARRMPGSNTGDLTETLVSLARQLSCMPTRSNTCKKREKYKI